MKVLTKHDIRLPSFNTSESGDKILHGCLSEPIQEKDIFEYEGERYVVTKAWQSRKGLFFINNWAITAICLKP